LNRKKLKLNPFDWLLLIAILVGNSSHTEGAEGITSTPEIVVSASRVPILAHQTGSSISVLSGDEIDRNQETSLSEILREIPGMAVSRAGPEGAFTQIRIRGTEGNHALVLIDGIEINDVSAGSEFDFGNMPTSNIERVEILRGPQSALYGSDAIGGVINIITKSGKGPPTVHWEAQVGSRRTAMTSVGVRGKTSKYNYSVGVSGKTTDGFSVANSGGSEAERDGNKFQNVNAKLGIDASPELKFLFAGRFFKGTLESDDQPAVSGKIVTIDTDDKTITQQRAARVSANLSLLDEKWQNILGLSFSDDRAESLIGGSPSSANGAKSRVDFQTNFSWDSAVFDTSHTLSLLIDRERDQQLTSSPFGNSDLAINSQGYSGEYRIDFWDRLFLSLSARYDNNDYFENKSTYRGTASYSFPNNTTRIHASYGTGAKNPTLFELYGFGPNFLPNSNLKPENSTGWDIGLEDNFLDGRLKSEIIYFKNQIRDLISGAGRSAQNLEGTSVIDGIELSGRLKFFEGISIKGQYTWTLGQDANATQLPRRPKHLASLHVVYRPVREKFDISLGLKYTGNQQDNEFSAFFSESQRAELKDFYLVNLSANYKITDRLEVYGRIENLFDKKYEEALSYGGPGFRAFIGLKGQFGLL
jgi:vitamin B12 transporter